MMISPKEYTHYWSSIIRITLCTGMKLTLPEQLARKQYADEEDVVDALIALQSAIQSLEWSVKGLAEEVRAELI